jgi:hypothetical protein
MFNNELNRNNEDSMQADGMSLLFNFIFTGVGGLVGYQSAAKVSDRKEAQLAGVAFYNSFNKVRMRLDPRFRVPIDAPHETKPGLIIKASFGEQTESMLKFRFYLPETKKAAFDKAWREYCCVAPETDPYVWVEKVYEPDIIDGVQTWRVALDRIDKLLAFVDMTRNIPFSVNSFD